MGVSRCCMISIKGCVKADLADAVLPESQPHIIKPAEFVSQLIQRRFPEF